jgi:glycine oxidase
MSARSNAPVPTRRRRIVVVGGGVVGCALAFELARAGLDVTLVERDSIAAHASGRNAGNLNPLFGATAAQLPATIAAFRRHAEICDALAGMECSDFALAPVERLIVGFEERERAGLQETAALFQATEGFSARWLEADEVRRTAPRLARDIAFAIYTTGSFSLDAAAFTRALASAAAKLGARIVRGAATGLTTQGDRIVSVRTVAGALACDEVVLATGPWAAEAAAWLGVETTVRPIKGEMLLVRLPGGLLDFDITGAGAALYKRRGNRTWLGVTATEEGFDVGPTTKARETLLSKARRILPEIAQAEVLDHVAALRPVAIPDAPIVRRAPGWANAMIANGGGSKGVLLAAGMARRALELLKGAEVPFSIIA